MTALQDRRVYRFDNFRLDVDNRRLLRNDDPISLSAKAFDLLQTLLENNGRLVGKDELFRTVWRDQIVEESNLTVHVSQIRKALGESKNNARYIETVPGYGYRFIGAVDDDDEDDNLVFETETLSRITIDKEDYDDAIVLQEEKSAVLHGVGSSNPISNIWSRPFPYLVATLGLIILAVLGLSAALLYSRGQRNSDVIAPAVPIAKDIDIRRLTSKGTVNRAVVSPDGKFFVYNLSEKGSSRSSLWLGQTDGHSELQLLPPADLNLNPRSFSADGNWVYYAASEPRNFESSTLYKMQVLGGVPQRLAGGVSIYTILSPDEKQIAFVRSSRENRTSALVIANLDGSDQREVTARPSEESIVSQSLSWSPDGRMIAFAAKVRGEKGMEVFSTDIAAGEVKQVTSLEWLGIPKLAWLNDGSGLVAVARDKNSFDSNQIWRIDYESGRSQKIINDLLQYGASLSLSADSSSLVALQAVLESNIWIAPSGDLAEARQITFGSSGQEGWYGMDWAPDGKIVYVARVDRSLTLWTMDADGANAKQITPVGFLDYHPAATGDGRHIVFESNRSGTPEIWRVGTDGSDLRQLTFKGECSNPHAVPNSGTVVFTHNAGGVSSVWRVSIDGGDAAQITDADCANARVSPDGQFIACGSRVGGKTQLTVIALEGGAHLMSFDVPPTYNFEGSIRWSRDGQSISYRDWMNGIWSQSVDGGKPKRLEGLPSEKLYTYDWSPDGKQLAFTRGRQMRDAVLITNFR